MPVSEWPYPLAHNNEEMRKIISNFDEKQYVSRVKKHHIICESYESEESCKRIVGLFDSY